jgi:hemoglobin
MENDMDTPDRPAPAAAGARAAAAGTGIATQPVMDLSATAPVAASHFLRLGGHDAVVRLVDAFYEAMDSLPEAATIRAMHDADLTQTRAVLARYFSEWLGGPRLFTPERGAPMLRRRHQRFAIDDAARDAWMHCMRRALAQVCTGEPLRAELDAALWKIADFMRNTATDSPLPHS